MVQKFIQLFIIAVLYNQATAYAMTRLMEKPRILLVLTEFPPRIGGMQTHALALANHLHRRGYAIEVVTYRNNQHEEKDALVHVDSKLSFKVNRVLGRVSFWKNIKAISTIAREFSAEILYSSTVFYGLLRRELHIPIICRSVGNDVLRPWIVYPFRFGSGLLGHPFFEERIYNVFKRFNYPEWIELFFHKRRHRLMADSARSADYILANSNFTAQLLHNLSIDEKQINVLVGGVDAQRFDGKFSKKTSRQWREELQLAQKAYLITTVCRLVAKKGIDFLLSVIPTLQKEMPDVHLLIIGGGRMERKYRRLIEERGLSKFVTLRGAVDQNEIQKYFWASDQFVLASREHIHPITGLRDVETMGRVLCEANAASVPVIAARSGGIPSVIRHGKNGLLFEPDNAQDLIQAVLRIRRDKTLRRRLTTHGKKLAEKAFDWSVVFNRHEKIIRRFAITSKRRNG